MSNSKLLNRNKTLEQFGYFTAHNIRGPVSSIMGLINLFRFTKDNEVEQNKIITLLKQSSDRLDGVVKDMITLLDFNKDELIECEEVFLSSLYLEAKDNFISKLSEKGNDIDFIERLDAGTCQADQIVVGFVLNQLLDNAYKFRDHNRKLVIEVWQVDEPDNMCFYVRDNGIGFDVSRFEDDIFGLYKKFHTSSFTGKGLGLYFIKEYMTRMKGGVSIEGISGVGVTVKLCFSKYKSN
jgi:signal transduction histidine kinase